ncbi:hypothetical protein M8C21_013037 [Ambrosia artemisiifolia]|uniref:Uncharacterized protein n=1 Tax=Ambrosia artemisiifolia TaxID=4212 RepID=A0AAD5D099_AMBAR|nr:hypothetical protein M8C21_013037 [Ambrosia artemisiifolia]
MYLGICCGVPSGTLKTELHVYAGISDPTLTDNGIINPRLGDVGDNYVVKYLFLLGCSVWAPALGRHRHGRHGNTAIISGEGTGLLRLHSTYRHDLNIYSSNEGRVQARYAATICFTCFSIRCVMVRLKRSLEKWGANVKPWRRLCALRAFWVVFAETIPSTKILEFRLKEELLYICVLCSKYSKHITTLTSFQVREFEIKGLIAGTIALEGIGSLFIFDCPLVLFS